MGNMEDNYDWTFLGGGCWLVGRVECFMKIPSYTQTAGLERFPERERFDVYRSKHQQLMGQDSGYRRRYNSFMAGVVCLALVPVLGWMGAIWLAWRQQEFQNRRIADVLQGRT